MQSTRRRWLSWLLVGALVLLGLHRRCSGEVGDGSWVPPAVGPGELRIATWNLENFPRPEQDRAWIRRELESLDADILGLQEIRDPAAVRALLPEHKVLLTDRGGRGGQRLALAWDPSRLHLLEAREDARLSMDGRVRPGLVVRLRARPHGPTVAVVVVHLKATSAGFATRQQQWVELAGVITELPADEPTLVLGDFNTTEISEPHRVAEALRPVGVQLVPLVGRCTAYWQGVRHDAWLEPSHLDLIFASPHVGAKRSQASGACARHACEPLQSTEAYPDKDVEGASDHCPVWVDATLW